MTPRPPRGTRPTAPGHRSTGVGPRRIARIGGLAIAYDQGVLEPRPWTVLQAEWAVELSDAVPPGPMLEVCSGVGHIGLVAAHRSGRRLVQVDRDPRACAFARLNARQARMTDDVDVRCTDIDDVARGQERFPLVIADPPYIASDQVGRFPADPLDAIDGGADGLDLARACLRLFRSVLVGSGRGLLQLGGMDQVEAMAREAGPDLELIEHRSAGPTRAVALFSSPT